jgi:hypothetical protein
MKKLIKDPLLHFLLIGALLFLAFEFIKSPAGIQENSIVITSGDMPIGRLLPWGLIRAIPLSAAGCA